MIALIVAWIFGASAFVDGCTMVLAYRSGTSIDVSDDPRVAIIQSDDHRAEAVQAAEHLLTSLYNARNRFFPLSVAGMLLGAVMVAFAARCMSAREGARGPLIQIVGAQAVLVIVAYFLTPDIRHAKIAAEVALFSAQIRQSAQDPQYVEKALAFAPRAIGFVYPAWLVGRSMLSLFILVALTRTKSREFFEAAEGRFSER